METVTATGHCATLSVDGTANHVNINSADSITVAGASNYVIINSVGTIDAGGMANHVTYNSGPRR